MTNAQYKLLEKVFAAEIEGRIHPSKDKRYKVLEAEGCVEHVFHQVGKDRFGPIVVTGWALTHKGRIIYCQWASKWEEKVINENSKRPVRRHARNGGRKS